MLANFSKIRMWSLIVALGFGMAPVLGCQTNHRHPPVASSSWPSGTPSLTTAPTHQPQASSYVHGVADGHRHADVPARTSGVVGLPYGGQRTCPVSGAELGSMGDPIPVAVKGQTVYVCCSGCVRKLKANPEEYVAKVREETGRGN